MTRTLTPAAVAATLLLAGCDATGVDPGPPLPDEIVDGVNLTDLFGSPTGSEVAAVRAEWAARDAARDAGYLHDVLPAVPAPDGADLIVYVARDAASGAVLHHGVVRLPPRAPGDVERRPVILLLPRDAESLTVDDALLDLPIEPSIVNDFVYVLSSFRGQTLTVGGIDFTSPADSSAAYDLDADDALALLDHAIAAEPLIDPDRVAVAGYDRGGTAALQIAERTTGVSLVSSLAAPTDFFLPSVRALARSYLRGESVGAFPAFDEVARTVLDPLRDGGGDPGEARLALIRRSPAHFVAPPPFVFAAHGTLDAVVPVNHGRALAGVQGTPDAVYVEFEEHDHGSLPRGADVVATATVLFIEKVRDP
jgi:hypothetical protein